MYSASPRFCSYTSILSLHHSFPTFLHFNQSLLHTASSTSSHPQLRHRPFLVAFGQNLNCFCLKAAGARSELEGQRSLPSCRRHPRILSPQTFERRFCFLNHSPVQSFCGWPILIKQLTPKTEAFGSWCSNHQNSYLDPAGMIFVRLTPGSPAWFKVLAKAERNRHGNWNLFLVHALFKLKQRRALRTYETLKQKDRFGNP